MVRLRMLHRERPGFPKGARAGAPAVRLIGDERGSAILEFAVSLPLLLVFVVGIYDFSAAFNQKQKIAQAAQEGAIVAGAQPMSDLAPSNIAIASNPYSLQQVVTVIFDSLAGSGVLPSGTCAPPGTVSPGAGLMTWKYTISGCNSVYPLDNLVITINRGWMPASGTPLAVGTMVTVQYPYRWRFGSVLQLLFPGPNGYLTPTQLTESATVHNQL